MVNPPHALSSNGKTYSDDDVFREIENYSEEAKRGDHIQVVDPPQYVLSLHAWLSMGASFPIRFTPVQTTSTSLL